MFLPMKVSCLLTVSFILFQWNVDNDMHSTCFICSRNSYDFEHQGGVSVTEIIGKFTKLMYYSLRNTIDVIITLDLTFEFFVHLIECMLYCRVLNTM